MNIESVLIKAKMDIRTLREYNQILKAKVEVMEVFAAALGFKRENQGAEVDICWEIEQALKQIESEKNAKVPWNEKPNKLNKIQTENGDD